MTASTYDIVLDEDPPSAVSDESVVLDIATSLSDFVK